MKVIIRSLFPLAHLVRLIFVVNNPLHSFPGHIMSHTVTADRGLYESRPSQWQRTRRTTRAYSLTSCLLGPRLYLWCRALGLLLRCDSTSSLATSSAGSGLCLLCLLLRFGGGFLFLCVLKSGLTVGSTGFWSLGAARLDHIKGSTDNSTLVLDCAAGSLLGDFLSNRSVWALNNILETCQACKPTCLVQNWCCSREVYDMVDEPLRFPSCAFFGRGLSRLFFEGSCVARKAIRFCHSGIGRSCCRHGRRACPISTITISL